jgi:O-antigen ligase/tetratricopeptide (TPR) repeat protein
MMERNDRRVLVALQVLVLGVPLLLGGRHPLTLPLALLAAIGLLVVTLHARREAGGGPAATGVAALAAFVALALATTVPLPPALFGLLSPAAARLTAAMLPGWPEAGAFSTWRPLALDSYAVWVELGRLALGFAVFATVVAYPWRSDGFDEPADERLLTRLVPTLVIGGSALAALGLLLQAVGNGSVLWISNEPTVEDRVSGPFINPNHFAAWLGMVIPVALAYAVALASRLRRRLVAAVQSGRGMGVRVERAWIAAFIANQRALVLPLAAATAVVLMLVAHLATGSRGGLAALLVGLGVAVAGMAARAHRRSHAYGFSRFGRFVPAAIALTLAAAGGATVLFWAAANDLADDGLDVNLASRLAVAAEGRAVVRDFPLVGSGLGSWLHAFRPYQAPPVEGGIWDHAHNDYLELTAETGLVGVAIVLAFLFAVGRTVRDERRARHAAAAAASGTRRERGHRPPPGFEVAEWRAALRDRGQLRWGIAGGIAAIMVHSLVDFGLRLPANFLLLMLLGGLLVTAGRLRLAAAADEATLLPAPTWPGAAAPAVMALLVLVAVTACFPAANAVRSLAGAAPLSPAAALERADLLLAEEGDDAQTAALALVHHALDWSPADRAAHEAEAAVRGSGPEAEAAHARAIALSPWAPELRDALALQLWNDDRRDAAVAELEESMFRYPYLVSHAYLSPESDVVPRGPNDWLRVLADGDTIAVRLAALDAAMAGAIERGLTRALEVAPDGVTRAGIVDDLATLLEARERFGDAAAHLRAEADRNEDGRAYLARAARAALRASDLDTAEETLLAALTRTPEQGRLYRDLALEVYAARGDFASAETVLRAGERNAVDLLPIHRGVSELVVRRETTPRAPLVLPDVPLAEPVLSQP